MGRAKLTLSVMGRPMLQIVLDTLRKTKLQGVVVVLGAGKEEIRRSIRFQEEKVVVNDRHTEGMSASLKAGIASVDEGTDAVLVVLGDMPLLSAATVDRLVDAYEGSKNKVVVPTYHGRRGNPVIIDKSLFPEVMKLGGDEGAKAVVAANKASTLEVPVEDAGTVTDFDSLADYEALRKLSSRPKSG
jgi:molybdenum cofactor cytidylyltransferase